jgi:hypothetical protein
MRTFSPQSAVVIATHLPVICRSGTVISRRGRLVGASLTKRKFSLSFICSFVATLGCMAFHQTWTRTRI